MSDQPHNQIWLQWYEYDDSEWASPTWCVDQQNDSDVEYVRRCWISFADEMPIPYQYIGVLEQGEIRVIYWSPGQGNSPSQSHWCYMPQLTPLPLPDPKS